MKSMTLVTLLMVTSIAFGQGAATPAPVGSAAPKEAAPTGAAPAKMTKKEAKAACRAEGKKGKGLKRCMRQKVKK